MEDARRDRLVGTDFSPEGRAQSAGGYVVELRRNGSTAIGSDLHDIAVGYMMMEEEEEEGRTVIGRKRFPILISRMMTTMNERKIEDPS